MINGKSILNTTEVLKPEQVLPVLKTVLTAKPEIRFAYLFGSLVSGTANVLSDIDVAIYIDPAYKHPPGGYGYKSELIGELSSLFSRTVDLVVLNLAPTLLKHRVVNNGILIFNRSETERRDFHEITNRIYFDLKPIYRVQEEYLRRRLQNIDCGGEAIG